MEDAMHAASVELLAMKMGYRMPTPTNFQIVHDGATMHDLQALEENAYHSHGTFQFALHQNIYIAFVAVSGLWRPTMKIQWNSFVFGSRHALSSHVQGDMTPTMCPWQF